MNITLIGSKRFLSWFDMWQEVLTLHGHNVHIMPTFKLEFPTQPNIENNLINYSDYVMLLNKLAYIGEDTMNELSYAITINKPIIALESWGKTNGIDYKHFKEVQDSAKRYDVWGKMSPIDTFNFIQPYHINILGPAGKLRNESINIIKQKEIIALGYDSNNLKHSWQKD